MPLRTVTRDTPQLSLRASFEPSTIDEKKRTVDLTWTTGAPVLRGYYDPYYEELSLDSAHVRMDRLQSGAAPLLNNHNSYDIADVIGVVESAQLGRKSGTATVRFDSGPAGEDAFRKVREGILRNVSVGYRTYKMQKVEGGDATIARYRAVDWEPFEVSMVPIGADAGAVTRSGGGMTPCEFIQQEQAMPDPTPPTTNPAPAVTPTPAPQPVAAVEQRSPADIERAAVERVLGIQRVGRALKRPDAEVAKAIADNVPLADYRAQAQDKFAEAETIQIDKRDPRIEAGEGSGEKWLRGASAWLVQRAAVGGVVAEHAKQTGNKVDLDPGEFRGLSLIDLARQSLERAGVRTAGMDKMALVGAALTQQRNTLGGAASTGDFPILLENVLYKVLLAQYGTTPDTWTKFCKVGSVTDFRASKRYRMGTFGSLSALNELGEFQNKSIPDGERQSLTAATKGNVIGISRQAIINDDMGAFTSLATMLGRAARLSIEVDVYALLASGAGLGPAMSDGNTLFHATHNNISTGAAIGSAAIDADRVKMASQTDPSGNEILALTPAVLVLPIGLGGVARQINTGQYDFDSTKFQTPNRVGNLFRDIIDTPRISGTRRYLFADPGIAPTIEVAFLDGQQQPFMDIQQGFRVDGVEWKVRMDYGVAAIDFRGAITNAGV
jgi:hypothetical protein